MFDTRYLLVVLAIVASEVLSLVPQRRSHIVELQQKPASAAEPTCGAVVKNYRFDCMPDPGDEALCKSRGCCWDSSVFAARAGGQIGEPYCYFPSNVPSYSIEQYAVVPGGCSVTLTRHVPSPWPRDVMTLKLDIQTDTTKRLRVKMYDPATARYEVPIERGPPDNGSHYGYFTWQLGHEPFSLTVTAGEGDIILDSSLVGAPLIFSDQFLEWSFRLHSPLIYGLGEHKESFLINASTGWQQRAFWARDAAPNFNENLYGTHPFFMGVTERGGAYGILLLNSNAMEIDLQPLPALTYRTTGGILDFYLFYGTTPDDVVSEYTTLVGRPAMPPLWGLGYHQCRWGYKQDSTLQAVINRTRATGIPYVVMEYTALVGRPAMPPLWGLGYHQCRYGAKDDTELKAIIARTRKSGMPYEVQWSDIDYMEAYKDWTYDAHAYKSLPAIVKDLHDNKQKYVIIVDPGIMNASGYEPFTSGLKSNVFITNSTHQPMLGKVWPGVTAFPDFTHPNTTDWWYAGASSLHSQLPFDGLWTDMNEPSNFVTGSLQGCTNSSLDKPPFTPGVLGGDLAANTLCPSAQQHLSTHYNLHSLYGHFEVRASHQVLEKLRGRRSFVISRSTFVGTGAYGGHWSGDISSTWEDLYYSIPDLLDFQLFGIPLMGADICGFAGDTTEELCTRWMQLGAFYPFMRNHNSLGQKDQDPGVWSKAAQQAMVHATQTRYWLLPYLYTLFHGARANGSMVLRPLVFQYPRDPETFAIDRQFFWGDAILVSPVLEQGATSVRAYFSPNDTYYDLLTGARVTSSGWTTLDAPLDMIPLHLRGGSIVPVQEPGQTTVEQQSRPYGLLVALTSQKHPYITGSLYQDDGDTLEAGNYNYVTFIATNSTLFLRVVNSDYTSTSGMRLSQVTVYGAPANVSQATVNGKPAKVVNLKNQMFRIEGFEADLLKALSIKWS